MPVDVNIAALDKGINELKYAYDQFFQGSERIPPSKKHDELAHLVRRMSFMKINNTGLRFRRNDLVARYRIMNAYWHRIMRQIEEGTYKRDLRRAKQLLDRTAKQATAAAEEPTAAATQASAPKASQAYRPIYDAYMKARQAAGISGQINYDKLAASLSNHARTLKAKYKCKRVAFRVSVQDGKAIIKAVPKN